MISSSSTDQSHEEEEENRDHPDHISVSSNDASNHDIEHLANYSGGKSSYHRAKGFGSTTSKSERLHKVQKLGRSEKKSHEMTEESFSAEEEDVTPPQYSGRISKSSATDLQVSAQKKHPMTGSTLEYDYEDSNRFKGYSQHGRRHGFMSAE